MSDMKSVKSITTKLFSVELVQLPNDNYCIFYESGNKTSSTGEIADFKTASAYFDDIIMRLEGH